MAGKMKAADLAAQFVGGTPLAFQLRSDGSMVVIGSDGRKQTFTAAEVRAAQRKAEKMTDGKGEVAI